MSLIILNSNGLEKEITEFENSKEKIKQIFENEKRNMRILDDGHSWVGKASEAMNKKQKDFQNNFDPIVEALETFIKFMKDALESYKEAERKTLGNISDNSESLDVNS